MANHSVIPSKAEVAEHMSTTRKVRAQFPLPLLAIIITVYFFVLGASYAFNLIITTALIVVYYVGY